MSEREVRDFFRGTIACDLLSLCIGDMIGAGSTRTVFRTPDPEIVLKFETSAQRFQNIMEWETWQIVKDTNYKEWFVPCINIADCGSILKQNFARDMEPNEVPETLPAFFADVKKENFGMYNGHVVCRDYGNHMLIDRGLTKKMIKADW